MYHQSGAGAVVFSMTAYIPPVTTPRCVLCHTPLDPLRAKESRVCRAIACRTRYERIPPEGLCRECGVPIPVGRQPVGYCEAPACLEASGRRRFKDAREQMERLWDIARAQVAEQEASMNAVAPDVQRGVTVVPRNTTPSRPASKKRHARFLKHLRDRIHASHEATPEIIAHHWEQPDELPADVGALFGAACAACRGWCCKGGGEHAFINVRTMYDYRAQHPHMSDEDIVEAYRAYLPERSLPTGCVYQASRGCTLPREMRAAICNKHLCHGLIKALSQHTEGPPLTGLHILHREGTTITYRRYVSLPVLDA